MSYFDFYLKNVNQNNESIRGTCFLMCPQEEVIMRQRESLVHVLEISGGERRLVKCFSRSAANSNMAVPSLLRPFHVLHKTIQHLLLNVTKRTDVSSSVMYHFIDDRLRAVRQDMTIQRIPSEQCLQLLEPMIRFYVYFGYKLCDIPLKDYDPVLSKKHLLECMKWFLSSCDDIKQKQRNNDINDYLSNLTLNTKYDRPLIESLYILCHLDDIYPLLRYVQLPEYLKSEPILQLSFKIGVAYANGNYVQLSRLIERLCPLTYCAFALAVPKIQRRAMSVLCSAYCSKQLRVPLAAVARWLGLCGADSAGSADADIADDVESAAAFCRHYRQEVAGDSVRFSNTSLADVPTPQPTKLERFEKRLNLSPSHVFTYNSYNIK